MPNPDEYSPSFTLKKSVAAWGTDDFERVFIDELGGNSDEFEETMMREAEKMVDNLDFSISSTKEDEDSIIVNFTCYCDTEQATGCEAIKIDGKAQVDFEMTIDKESCEADAKIIGFNDDDEDAGEDDGWDDGSDVELSNEF